MRALRQVGTDGVGQVTKRIALRSGRSYIALLAAPWDFQPQGSFRQRSPKGTWRSLELAEHTFALGLAAPSFDNSDASFASDAAEIAKEYGVCS